MREEFQRVRIDGRLLQRLILHPSKQATHCAIFYHGQGDYAERYAEVLYPFVHRGVRCYITELPGHGRSPGRRGHCGDEMLLDAMIHDTLDQREGLPYGVMGHSMGGLLALRHLILSGQGVLPEPAFAWLSSPLLKPSSGRPPWMVKMAHWLSPLIPSFTLSTGVTPEMCRKKSVARPDDEIQKFKHQLWHDRVSLGWAQTLLRFEKRVEESLNQIPESIPIVYTQGADDPICRAEVAREYVSRMPSQNMSYYEFDGLLHETFRGDGNEKFFAVLEEWAAQHIQGK